MVVSHTGSYCEIVIHYHNRYRNIANVMKNCYLMGRILCCRLYAMETNVFSLLHYN